MTRETILASALKSLLGETDPGAIAFARCFTREIMEMLCKDTSFSIPGWKIFGVVDGNSADHSKRLIRADQAVEMREEKRDAILLLVDVDSAGAGMDGIYSAAREVSETELFERANKLAKDVIMKPHRKFVDAAVRQARKIGRRHTISPWTEFAFYSACADSPTEAGGFVCRIGLWPIYSQSTLQPSDCDASARLVEKALLDSIDSNSPVARLDTLMLKDSTEQQKRDLGEFLKVAANERWTEAIARLEPIRHLWLGNIHPGFLDQRHLENIKLDSWRKKAGEKPYAWSGLSRNEEGELTATINLEPQSAKDRSKLEVRWRTSPDELSKDAVEYSIKLITGSKEDEFIEQKAAHSGNNPQRYQFTESDFDGFEGNEKFLAKIKIEVIGRPEIPAVETEDFFLQFGTHVSDLRSSSGITERSLVEGLLVIEEQSDFDELIKQQANPEYFSQDKKNFVVVRIRGTSSEGKVVRVYRPPLLEEVEEQWAKLEGAVGRWICKVRADGSRIGELEFLPIDRRSCPEEKWDGLQRTSQKLCEYAMSGKGFVSVVYGETRIADQYLNAWLAALELEDPELALAQTVEVRTLSGKTLGVIVLPSHPVRVAWHQGFDTLARWTHYEGGVNRKKIVEILSGVDGSHFPAFLPGLAKGESFVFGDTLGFYAVAMVSDADREPKAAIAQMARALSSAEDLTPSTVSTSAELISSEIRNFIDLHPAYRTLHVHALRPGDGLAVVRGLRPDTDEPEGESPSRPAFVLELYPSKDQTAVVGRFLSQVSERRRSGSGGIGAEDRWMFETYPAKNGIAIPRLRWAKREKEIPDTPAHLSIAFDIFDPTVRILPKADFSQPAPWEVYGLVAAMTRRFSFTPGPMWMTYYPPIFRGERHPAGNALSDRLNRIQSAILRSVARNIGGDLDSWPVLCTSLLPEHIEALQRLHNLSDWVITIDRNAGVEYFDSPREAEQIYESYVIDCVPEREELGCLQLVTSTSNFDEVMTLLNEALGEMALSNSRRNCEFLLRELKGLSGRLAMRLAGPPTRSGELIALALVSTNCRRAEVDDPSWLSLKNSFFVPLDDVPDLLPLRTRTAKEDETNCRGDLLLVSLPKKGGLRFQVIEVKFRRHLRSARSAELCRQICEQTETTFQRFKETFFPEKGYEVALSVYRNQLARILRFYADKAHRHFLSPDEHIRLREEIDRMVELGGNYEQSPFDNGHIHRGYIFCPEFRGQGPESTYRGDSSEVFVFGPALMPDTSFRDPIPQSTLIPLVAEESQLETRSEQATEEEPSVRSEGTQILLGESVQSGDPVLWTVDIRSNPHLMIVGLPGMGKTHCLVNLCAQLVSNQIVPIIFSYHEDIDDRLASRVENIKFVDYNGLGFNPMKVTRPNPSAFIDNASMVRDIFSSIFPDLGDLQLEYLRSAVKDSYTSLGWGRNVEAGERPPAPTFQSVYDGLEKSCPDKKLLMRLRELNDYGFFSGAGSESTVLDAAALTLVRIHLTQNESLQRAFSSFILHNIYQSMFARGEQRSFTHAIVIDEAHRASRLKLLPTLAKECRKYGIFLIIASQEARDFNVSLFSAIGNYLVLRVTDQDAKALADQCVPSQARSKTIDRLKQLSKYHGIFFGVEQPRPEHLKLKS